MNTVKKSILNNQFIYNLRTKFEIDEESYSQLVYQMQNLKKVLSTEATIDKELFAYLYVIPNIIRGQNRNEYSEDQRERLNEMEIEIDNLIIEILN